MFWTKSRGMSSSFFLLSDKVGLFFPFIEDGPQPQSIDDLLASVATTTTGQTTTVGTGVLGLLKDKKNASNASSTSTSKQEVSSTSKEVLGVGTTTASNCSKNSTTISLSSTTPGASKSSAGDGSGGGSTKTTTATCIMEQEEHEEEVLDLANMHEDQRLVNEVVKDLVGLGILKSANGGLSMAGLTTEQGCRIRDYISSTQFCMTLCSTFFFSLTNDFDYKTEEKKHYCFCGCKSIPEIGS